jgi:hypothetical protein
MTRLSLINKPAATVTVEEYKCLDMNKDMQFYPAIALAIRYSVDPIKRWTAEFSCRYDGNKN